MLCVTDGDAGVYDGLEFVAAFGWAQNECLLIKCGFGDAGGGGGFEFGFLDGTMELVVGCLESGLGGLAFHGAGRGMITEVCIPEKPGVT